MSRETVLFETNTDLEHYIVVERTYEGRSARVLFSGVRRAAQSGIGLDDNPDLLFDYNQRLLEIANALYPKRILIIGGGAFTLPIALTTALPDAHIDVVEIDSGLEQIARDYFGLQTSERLQLHFSDGRAFVEQTQQQYDLIIIDAFSELLIPGQLLTVEFAARVHSLLSEHGALAMNIIASYQGRNAGLIKSQVAAYQEIFEDVTLFPAAYGLTSWLPQNLVLVAQKQPDSDLPTYVRYKPIGPLETSQDDIRRDADLKPDAHPE